MAKRKMSENSLKNLKPNTFNDCEIAKKAQKKSVEKRKENQTLAELMKIALTLKNEETGEINNIAITNALINKAIKGDVSAYQTIRDTIGEKPVDKQEIKTNQPAVLSEYSEKKIEEVLQRIKKTTYE